jgi:hypothetical protein
MAEEELTIGNEFIDALEQSIAEDNPPEDVVETTTELVDQVDDTPVQDEPEPEPASPVEPDTAAILREAARSLGLSVSDDESIDQIATFALQQIHREKQVQKILAERQYQPEPAPAPQPAAPKEEEWSPEKYFQDKWGVPQWKPEYDQAVQSGILVLDSTTGLYKPAPGYESVAATLVGPINEAERARQQTWQKLGRDNLYKNVYDVTREPLLRDVEAKIAEAFQRQQAELQAQQQQTAQQSVVEKFEQENAEWLYRKNVVTGQHEPTPDGQALIQAITELRESGVQDQSKLLELALKVTGLGKRPEPAAAPSPEPAKPSQSPQQSFLDKAMRKNAHSPNATGPGTELEAQVEDEGDLNNLFVRAYQQRSR